MAALDSSKRRVSVTFAGDDEVLQHIVPINERKTNLRNNRRSVGQKRVSYADERPEDLQEEDEEEEEDVFKPSEALMQDGDLTGGDVFSFQTPKKSGQMLQRASESAKASTPGSKSRTPRTPKSALKQTPSKGVGTPRGRGRGAQRGRKLAATTPHRLSARNRDVADSSSDDSVMSNSEDDVSDSELGVENLAPTPKKDRKSVSRTPKTPVSKRKRKRDVVQEVERETVEAYFDAQTFAGETSDKTLSRLDTPRMDQEMLTTALTGVDIGYATERESLYSEYRGMYRRWMFQLCNGFNLLLHGLGSKRKVMETFRLTCLKNFNHIVVNGYFPSITIKHVLNAITEEVLEHHGSFRSPLDQCDFIRSHYESGEYEDFYLIIHNIDGAMFRPEKTQAVFSMLAQIRGIHFIASLDHINGPLIWDQAKCSRFKWLWYDVTTYESYSEETSYENSLLVQQSGTLALSSLTHVMKSLTPNARGIFLLLVRYQLENKDNPTYQGLAFPDLYMKCREAFLVNSDLTLRTQLTEFKDHKLVKLKKGYDGMEYLTIPLDTGTLNEFLEQQED